VRSDGKLISLTYVREQQVVGWALHSTDGYFESVCVVPEGEQDVLYASVRRTIDNVERVSLERMRERDLVDQRDAFFVDSGLTFDGRAQSGTQTLTDASGDWLANTPMTLTGSLSHWVGSSDVDDYVRLRIRRTSIVNGDEVVSYDTLRLRILTYTSGTVVGVMALSDVPVAFRNTAISDWEVLRDTMTGLDHLEGETVSSLADGMVLAQQVVEAGTITIEPPAAVVHAGLPYQSLIESLDVNLQGAETVRNVPKIIKSVALLLSKSRGLKSGPNTSQLDDFKVREFEGYEDPLSLVDGLQEVNVDGSFDKDGRFVVVQDDPLPVTILALIPRLVVGGDT
jgi:hypothetical protein